MSSERWQQVKEICGAALELAPAERPAYLDAACRRDAELRREVEVLLDSYDSEYLEQPAVQAVAEHFAEQTIADGQTVAHYKILKKIGAGGMGEVFLAEDTKLRRQVAVKFLSAFAADFQTEKRLLREAQAAATLDHPNICTIYEVGISGGRSFIVMQYIEGETLAERLTRGALPVGEAVRVAAQIADALGEAHAAGIIHRDIKPSNVIIDRRGQVKVLDFSLAKKVSGENESESLRDLSKPGQLFGTVAYMSPEQARGLPLDGRSDLWSLGVCLYEMLTGRHPFAGATNSDLIAAILKSEAAPLALPDREISLEIERILKKALAKDRAARYRTAAEFLSELRKLPPVFRAHQPTAAFIHPAEADAVTTRKQRFSTGEQTTATHDDEQKARTTQKSFFSPRRVWSFGTVVLLIGGLAAWFWWQRARTPATDLSALRPRLLVSSNGEAGEGESGARFSPGGTMIAYSLMKDGRRSIWTKQVPDGKPNLITDDNSNYRTPIWSPDGQRIACLSDREGQTAIWALPFSGGEMRLIKLLDAKRASLKHWSKDGATIYYQADGNLFALDIASGNATRLTNFDAANPAQFISVSPEGERLVYSLNTGGRLHLFTAPIGGQPVQITNDDSNDEYPVWLPGGERIIYSCKRDGIFQTCLVNLRERRVEQINLGVSDTLVTDVSADGRRILFTQSREECDLWQANLEEKSETQVTSDYGLELWADVAPDNRNIVFQAAAEAKHLHEGSILIRSTEDSQPLKIASEGFNPMFSPDGARVAFLRFAGNAVNLWTVSRIGADEKRLTDDDVWFDGFDMLPYNRAQTADYSWSPSGGEIIYCSKKQGIWNVWSVASDGTGAPRRITDNSNPNLKFVSPLHAPDGRRVAFTASGANAADGKNSWSLRITDGEKTDVVFSSASVLKLLGWTPDGSLIAAAREGGEYFAEPARVKLLQIVPGENAPRAIAAPEAVYFDNLRLSPDGQKIAAAARTDGRDNLQIIAVASGQIVTVTAHADPHLYLSGIVWAPDGKTVFFSKQQRVSLISMIENFK